MSTDTALEKDSKEIATETETTEKKPEEQEQPKAIIVPTIDYAIFDKWYRTVSETMPIINVASKVVKQQYFYIPILFISYGIDKSNTTNIGFDIKIITPDNKVYLEPEHLLGTKVQLENTNVTLVSEEYLIGCFKPEDSYGVYPITATIYDNVLNESYDISTEIELVKMENTGHFASEAEYLKWMNDYHDSPEPLKAIEGYIMHSKISESDTSNYGILSFFTEIFKSNEYLIPHLIDAYKTQDLRTRVFIILLLHHLENKEATDFLTSLEGEEKEAFNNIKDENILDLSGEIVYPYQLDILWGIFLASGKYEPVLRLVRELGSEESKPMIYTAVRWSIRSNCEQYRLVKDYCYYIYYNETISDTVKQELEVILADL